jgi:HEAT repeat protein
MKALLAFCFAAALAAQSPPIVKNGAVETRAFAGDLATQLKSTRAAWFGYEIKTERKTNQWCDGRYQNPIQLEGSDRAAVLLRIENNQLQKLRIYSLTCELDTGGLPFVWLTGVSADASLAYLNGLLKDGSEKAIFAISQHAGMQATDMLINAAKNNQSPHLREQALFWLAQRAGEKSAAAIVDAIANDPDTEVKKKAVFALSQLPGDEGVPKLIEVARTQRNPQVRKQAFFWLGQSHDARAFQYIEDVLTK